MATATLLHNPKPRSMQSGYYSFSRALMLFFTLLFFLKLGGNSYAANPNGIYTGEINCNGKSANISIFVYNSINDIQYIKYQEHNNRGKILSEVFYKGALPKFRKNFPRTMLSSKEFQMNLISKKSIRPHWNNFHYFVDSEAPTTIQYEFCSQMVRLDLSADSTSSSYRIFLTEIKAELEKDKFKEGVFGLIYYLNEDKLRIYQIGNKEWLEPLGDESDIGITYFFPYPLTCETVTNVLAIDFGRRTLDRSPYSIKDLYGFHVLKSTELVNSKAPVGKKWKECLSEGDILKITLYDQKGLSQLSGEEYFTTFPDLKYAAKGAAPEKIHDFAVSTSLYKGYANFSLQNQYPFQSLEIATDNIAWRNDLETVKNVIERLIEVYSLHQDWSPNMRIPINIVVRGQLDFSLELYSNVFHLELALSKSKTPKKERIHSLDCWSPLALYIEYIHYGLFDLARSFIGEIENKSLLKISFKDPFYLSYFANYSELNPDFFSKDVTKVDITIVSTEEEISGWYRTIVRSDTTFSSILVEPKYEEYLLRTIYSIKSYYAENALRYAGGFNQVNIMNEVTGLICYINPESPAISRFTYNLHAFATGGPPLASHAPKPYFKLEGILLSWEKISIEDYFKQNYNEKFAGCGSITARSRYQDAIAAGILESQKILRATYQTRNGEKIYRYFWADQLPKNYDNIILAMRDGNYILSELGPAVSSVPPTLEEAIALIIDFNYQ